MSKLTFNYWGKYYPSVSSFEEAEKLYKDTKPIRGPRKVLDIRPIGNDRYHNYGMWRVVKVNNKQYTLTGWWEGAWHVNLTTTKRGSVKDNLGVTWTKGQEGFRIYTGWWGNSQLNFYSQVLPIGMWLTRYDTKIYLSIKRLDTVDHYLIPKPNTYWNKYSKTFKYLFKYLDVQKVDGEWHVTNPIQEYRRRVTAKLQQKVLKDRKLREFENYANTMWDMLTPDIAQANGANNLAYWTNDLEKVKKLLSDKSEWVKACCELKQVGYLRYGTSYSSYVRKSFDPTKIRRTLYKVHKDKFNTTEVPIGTTCCRHWLDK